MRLSLAMIVKDDEHRIAGILDSASSFCDELIVVDTGSSDATCEIAQAHGASVSQVDWTDDFSAARNASFYRCTGDWIVWFDADDVIPPASQQAFATIKGELGDEFDAVVAPYHYRLADDGTPLLIRYQERLIRREADLWWEGRAYEWITVPFGRSVPNSSLVVERRPDANHQSRDADLNIKILEDAVVSGDRTPQTLFHYANELHDRGRFEEAALMYRQYLAVDEESADRYWGLLYLSESLLALGDADAAEEIALKALSDDSSRAEAYVTLGRIRYDSEAWDEAVPLFIAGTSGRRPPVGFVRNSDYLYTPWDYLSVCLEKLGRLGEGIATAQRALAGNPEADRVRANLRWMIDRL